MTHNISSVHHRDDISPPSLPFPAGPVCVGDACISPSVEVIVVFSKAESPGAGRDHTEPEDDHCKDTAKHDQDDGEGVEVAAS